MPHFETFTKRLVPLKREPYVTIQRRGTMSLNKSAYVTLGSPAAVELLYDVEERIVGLRPVDPRADHAYLVRPANTSGAGPFAVSAMSFTRFYDIDTTQSLRWPAYLEDGVLCIDLNERATPVTSNRAGTSRRPGRGGGDPAAGPDSARP